MDYLGDKLTVAQGQVTQWMGTVRRSFQEALSLVSSAVGPERAGGEPSGRTPFKRTSSFRHLASRSRESFRRFSARSQQRFSSLRKRQPDSEPPDLVSLLLFLFVCSSIKTTVRTPPCQRSPSPTPGKLAGGGGRASHQSSQGSCLFPDSCPSSRTVSCSSAWERGV